MVDENNTEVSNEQTQVDADKFYGEADESSEVDAVSEEVSNESEESSGTIADGNIESEESEDSSEEEEAVSKESEDAKDELFELDLPEGSLLDAQQAQEFADFAKENGLSKEVAQKLFEKSNSVVDSLVSNAVNMQAELRADWKRETINDAELGGDNLVKTSENAKRVLEKFGNDAIKNLLRETRYGDHIEVVRLFNKIGEAMAEDNLILGSGKTKTEKSFEERFYNGN